MATYTTNFGWTKPGVNDPTDADLWGTELNSNLDAQDTLVKNLTVTGIGNSAPSYLASGTMWIDNTSEPWILKVYDGTSDVTIGTISTVENQFTVANGVMLSNKGDLLTSNGSVNTTLPVGADDQVLIADSSEASGVKWGGIPGYDKVKAWVTVDVTTGTPTILASDNISSISDLGVGRFVVNFTNALDSANYVVAGMAQFNSTSTNAKSVIGIITNTSITTTACPIFVCDFNTGFNIDPKTFRVAFIGG